MTRSMPTVAILLGLAGACREPADVHTLQGRGLGTTWTVTWIAPPSLDDAVVSDAVIAELASVDAAMSTWRDDSELARIRATEGPVRVSEPTAAVVAEALWIAEATGGAFDPTVQPLVELWGFHGERRTTLPTDAEIEDARAHVGWDRVTVGRTPDGPVVDAGGTALDLSAIAKGYAVDRISGALSHLGLPDHLVEVGGEVRVHGRSPEGPLWRVGVDMPVFGSTPGEALAGVVAVTNMAIATSGNYRQQYTIEGRRIHHTLDPRTGWPTQTPVASATVIAPTCTLADGLATALMVTGPEGLAWIDALPSVEAWLLVPSGDQLVSEQTDGFALHLVTESTARVPASDR